MAGSERAVEAAGDGAADEVSDAEGGVEVSDAESGDEASGDEGRVEVAESSGVLMVSTFPRAPSSGQWFLRAAGPARRAAWWS